MSVLCTHMLLSLFEAQKLQDRFFCSKNVDRHELVSLLRISKASQADNMLHNSCRLAYCEHSSIIKFKLYFPTRSIDSKKRFTLLTPGELRKNYLNTRGKRGEIDVWQLSFIFITRQWMLCTCKILCIIQFYIYTK